MVRVGVGTDDGVNAAAGGVVQALQVGGVGRAGVNDGVAGGGVTDQVAVGAGPGHHARVGSGQAHHVFQQAHRLGGLPVQVMGNLPVRANQCQLAVGRVVFHITCFLTRQPARTRAGVPQRLLTGAGRQHRVCGVKALQTLQRAKGRKDHEKIAGLVPRQGLGRADPAGFELLELVSDGGLSVGHAGDQKRHVKAARQVAVGDPVGQHKHIGTGQCQAACGALRCQRHSGGVAPVHRLNVSSGGKPAVCMPGQQHAQLFKAFADGRHGFGQSRLGLRASACGLRMAQRVGGLQAAAWKHIRAGGKAGGRGAPRHQHFNAGSAVSQQQNSGGSPGVCGFVRRVKQLGGSYHSRITSRRFAC